MRKSLIDTYQQKMAAKQPWDARLSLFPCALVLNDPEMLELARQGDAADKLLTLGKRGLPPDDRLAAIRQLKEIDPSLATKFAPELKHLEAHERAELATTRRNAVAASYQAALESANPHLHYIRVRVSKTRDGYALWGVHDFFGKYSLSIGDDAPVIGAWIRSNHSELDDLNITRIGVQGASGLTGASWFDLKAPSPRH